MKRSRSFKIVPRPEPSELRQFAMWFHQDCDLMFSTFEEGARIYFEMSLPRANRHTLRKELARFIADHEGSSDKALRNAWRRLGAEVWHKEPRGIERFRSSLRTLDAFISKKVIEPNIRADVFTRSDRLHTLLESNPIKPIRLMLGFPPNEQPFYGAVITSSKRNTSSNEFPFDVKFAFLHVSSVSGYLRVGERFSLNEPRDIGTGVITEIISTRQHSAGNQF